jgi:hypothetical protein
MRPAGAAAGEHAEAPGILTLEEPGVPDMGYG